MTQPDPLPAVPVELFGEAAQLDAEAEVRRILIAAGLDPDSGVADSDQLNVLEHAPADDDAPEAWRIRSQGEADWAMAQYGVATRRIAELDAQLRTMVENANRWRRRAGAWADRDAAFFRGHLERYALEVRETGPKTKAGKPKTATLHTLYGDVPTKAGADGVIVIADPDELAAWADKHAPNVVRKVPEVLVSTLRSFATVSEDDPDTVVVAVVDDKGEVTGTATIPAGLVEVIDRPATASAPKPDALAIEALIEAGKL